MALLPHGSLTNVYASIDQYLQERFVDPGLLTVRLHGERRFVPPVDDPWLEAHYTFLHLQSLYRRQVRGLPTGEDVFGVHREGHLQLNLFQRARVFTTRYTTAATRDLVVDAFPEAGMLQIYDYTGQAPDTAPVPVGLLIFDGIQEHVQDDGYDSGIIQHVLQIQTRYLEQYTRTG